MNLKNATISKIETMADRSIKIILNTREMPPKDMAELFFAVNNEMTSIEIPEDAGDVKSPSTRLRNVLYKIYETTNQKEKFSTFTLYYNHTMERIIEKYKEYII